MKLEVLDNQNIEPEVSNDQNVEPEALDNQDVELEVLAVYNSTDDFSDIDIDNFDDIEGFSIGKTFKNWDQVADFMKKYAIIKGHRIRIGGGGWEKLLQDYPQSTDVQSTSRNEGENSTLKRLFGSSSLSLCELFEALEERYQEETDYFIQQLNEFVMPNIMKKQEKQMNLNFYYHAVEIDLKAVFFKEKEVDESEQCIDNFEFDVNEAEEFANCGSNQSPNEISKAISKKHKFSELWGLGKKIIVNTIENSNEDIYYKLLGFFTSIQNRTLPQRIISEVSDVDNFSHKINNDGCMISIRNPVKKRSKGRSKSKRIANAFEKSDTKTMFVNLGYEELSTMSTSHESVRDMSDTEESVGPSNPVVLISSSTQPIDFQNCERTQRQCR
ncbi:12808_t:CDS:2, partial [Cetraspora pellucida]